MPPPSENHGSLHVLLSKKTKIAEDIKRVGHEASSKGLELLDVKRETEKRGQHGGESSVTNGTGRTAWLLLLIQQPDGNTLKSVGGECFASRRVLQSCLPQGPAECPRRVRQGPRIYIFRQTSNNASLQPLPFGQGGGERRLRDSSAAHRNAKRGHHQRQTSSWCHQPWHCPFSDPAFPSPHPGADASSCPAPSQALPPQFLASEELSKEIRERVLLQSITQTSGGAKQGLGSKA